MHDLLDDIDRWRSAGHRIAVARVVDIEGSGLPDLVQAVARHEQDGAPEPHEELPTLRFLTSTERSSSITT